MIDLSVVVVNWNVRDLLRNCLRFIYASWGAEGQGLEVIVVDNASADGSLAMVRAEFPQALLISNKDNVGFTVGNNQAIARARGRYVLLLNPDTEVLGNALREMVAYLDAHPDVGVVGPKLLNANGTIQSSRRRFPTIATALLESTILQGWSQNNAILRHYYVLDRSDDEEQDVDWVVGACLMARRETFEQIGMLDEGFFMYSEELDWCYRLKQAGWRVVYFPTAQVVHFGGQSSQQVVATQHIHFQRSKIRFFRKHHGPLVASLLRGFLWLTYVYQLVLELGKWLVGHKRPLRAERIRTYSEVLRSGL